MEILKSIFLFLIIVFLIIIFQRKYKFTNNTRNYFILVSLVPFLLIDFLFPPEYMWDIIVYEGNVTNIRSFKFGDVKAHGIDMYAWSYLLSFIPLPYLDSPLRLGFASKIMYIIFLIYLIHKKEIKENELLFMFLLFWPSILIYSSLGLREVPILLFSYFSLYYLIEKKFIYSLLFLFLLSVFKLPTAVLIIISYLMYFAIFEIKMNRNFLILLFIITSLIIFIFFGESILNKMNYHRLLLYEEDGGIRSNYESLDYNFRLIVIFLKSGVSFFFSPNVNDITNTFRFFQFIENIFLFLIVIYYSLISIKINKAKTTFWILQFYLWLAIYGMVSFNPGSISRWKVHLVLLFFLVLNFNVINKNKKKYFKKLSL